ncbi:hypothetical protein [Halostagnicola sp. A-GB9-2]|nr:hypothetical protein [Halostagnicola sp. A-GB9-2]MDJ1433980.1 hypothetical protein [Halostagnicola sp. A-GB9-2]
MTSKRDSDGKFVSENNDWDRSGIEWLAALLALGVVSILVIILGILFL